jgi:hypothetical protein
MQETWREYQAQRLDQPRVGRLTAGARRTSRIFAASAAALKGFCRNGVH